MSEKISKVYGIDLGTTYSCIAYVDEHERPIIIPNFDNNRITPSVVFFDGDNKVVGEEAKNSLTVYPEKVVTYIKREIGNENFLFEDQGVQYSPEEISSFILRKLVKDAEQNLGEPVKDVVITCPAYFGINEREATRRAGEIAGLNVKEIINEPTAAAIAYGIDSGEDKVVLVFDLGGGTFDITMIDIKTDSIKVIVTGGDQNLGGKNWDDTIITYLATCFNEETGTDEDILLDIETLGELQLVAERAKKTLTQREKTSVPVIHNGERVKVEITKEKFEELTAALLERTISLTNDMLTEAKKKGYEAFDEIILVGGSTKMPQIKSKIDETFNTDAKSFDPDEAVAKGAAIFGQKTMISDELKKRIAAEMGTTAAEIDLGEVADETLEKAAQEVADDTGLTIGQVTSAKTTITDVTSKSFGVIAIDRASSKEILSNLILKNETVPTEITKTYGTFEENQDNIDIRILESEVSDKTTLPENGREIGTALLNIPPGLPANSPIQITFKINREGRLDIKAVETTENRVIEITIETSSVISGKALEDAMERSNEVVVL